MPRLLTFVCDSELCYNSVYLGCGEVRRHMESRGDWASRWTPVVAVVAWVLANILDVFSVLLLLQMGGRLPFVRHHTAEYFFLMSLNS